jgi:hypothetical protein
MLLLHRPRGRQINIFLICFPRKSLIDRYRKSNLLLFFEFSNPFPYFIKMGIAAAFNRIASSYLPTT